MNASPEQTASSAGRNVSWSQNFRGALHRYRVLLRKYWWVPALTLSLCLCAAAWYLVSRPPMFYSSAKLNVSQESTNVTVNSSGNGGGVNQAVDDFIAAQKEFIKSADVARMTEDRLLAQYPDMAPAKVKLDMRQLSSILILEATSTNPLYTQRWLKATLDSYLSKRKSIRDDANGRTLEKIDEQIVRAQEDIKADDDAMIAFQREHKVIFGKEGSTPAEKDLIDARAQLSAVRAQNDQLAVMTPERGFGAAPVPQASPAGGGGSAQAQSALESSSAEADYRQAQLNLVKLKADRDTLGVDMRPEHPRMQALTAQVESQQKQISSILDQNAKRLANLRVVVAANLKAAEEQLKKAEAAAQEESLLKVAFEPLVQKQARDTNNYDELQKKRREGSLGSKAAPEVVEVVDQPSAPMTAPAGWPKVIAAALLLGTVLGVGILLLIERLDDRMGSVSDFQSVFPEHILGQIPRDGSEETTDLLLPDDQRHQLVESFRNLRSTLLYMPMDGQRPKTLLVTSAIPNEGKSTVSSNLALVLAFAGKKTLLIDCDLRRGAIHKAFDLKRMPGLTDVLGHNVNWKVAIKESGVENLHILPRGKNVPQPGEYLLRPTADALLKELYPLYDYIVIDSSPILAADDTASLAPKIDATLFVVRLSFTAAKETRKALEVLYKRQANIPGLILNQVDTSSPEFVYYQYSDYYHTASPAEDAAEDAADAADDQKPKSRRSPHQPSSPESVKARG